MTFDRFAGGSCMALSPLRAFGMAMRKWLRAHGYFSCCLCRQVLSLSELSSCWNTCFKCAANRSRLSYKKKRKSGPRGSPEQCRAWRKIHNAIRFGNLVRPKTCFKCGRSPGRIEAHHSDYSKLLEVEWLCSRCHTAIHKKK